MKRLNRLPAAGTAAFLLLAITVIGAILTFRIRTDSPDFLTPGERSWLMENRQQIEVLFGYEAPPNAFHDENGNYTGLLVDFMHEIESTLNVTFTMKNLPTWNELLMYAREHRNIVIVGIAETPERETYLSFTDPFIKVPYVLVTKEQTPAPSLDGVQGQTVCTVSGYAINDFLKERYPDIKPSQVRNNLAGLRAVATGQCDVMVINQAYASYLIQNQGLAGLNIAGESGYLNRLCAAASKRDPILQKILDKAVDRISPDRRDQLFQKWVLFSGKKQFLPPEAVNTLLIATGIFLCITAILWFWSMSLRATVRRQTRQITADLDRLKATRADLRKNEQMYRGVIEHSGDGIFLATTDRLEIVNRRFLELFEVSREEAQAPAFDLFSHVADEHRMELAQGMQNVRTGKVPGFTLEFSAISGSEKQMVLEGTFAALKFDNGVAVQGILRDITARLQLEEQLRQSQKMEAIGRLAGGVAHDFNNMLTVINGYSDLLLTSLPQGSPAHSQVRQIHYAGERAATLTGQLLAFSRKQMTAPAPISLNRTIAEMQPMLSRLIGEDITLEFLPGDCEDLVLADPGQIEQILLNLAGNAREAMPDGGTLHLDTDCVELSRQEDFKDTEAASGRHVMLAVSDSGTGMDQETVSRIFEPFFTTKDTPQSTGLGLATVYGIVKQCHGHITVQSEPGNGTIFRIYLPVTEQREKKESNSRPAPSGKETILVVEDEPHVRELTGEVLEELGYSPLLAASPAEALKIAAAKPTDIDLVLTDVIMPEMNGRELVTKLTPLLPRAKVLYMSGYTGSALSSTNELPPETRFLQKPFSPKQMAHKIRSVLDEPSDFEEVSEKNIT